MTAVAAAALVLSSSPAPVAAMPRDSAVAADERAKAELRRQQAELAAQLDVAGATDDQLVAALVTLDRHVSAQFAEAADNHRAIEDAQRRAAQADAELGETQAQIDRLTADFRRLAVERYVTGDGGDTSLEIIATGDFGEAGSRKVLASLAHGDSRALREQLQAARARADELTRVGGEARTQADALQQQRAAMATQLKADGDAQARIRAEWDKRLEAKRAEHERLEAAEAERTRAATPAPAPVAVPPALGPRLAPAANAGGGKMIWPMEGKISRGWLSHHKGIDIWHTPNTPIYAALGGTVTETGDEGDGYGNKVMIDHGNGLATMYAHQSRIVVRPGQSVGQGEHLGYQGSTGNSTGPHLHFEVHVGGRATNPAPYLPAR